MIDTTVGQVTSRAGGHDTINRAHVFNCDFVVLLSGAKVKTSRRVQMKTSRFAYFTVNGAHGIGKADTNSAVNSKVNVFVRLIN